MKILGRKKLEKRMAAMPDTLKTEVRKALNQNADDMVSVARSFVPKRSGRLERSIGKTEGKFKPENSNVRGVSASAGSDLSVTVHAGDAKAWYAALVEFGTAPHRNGGMFEGSMHPGASPEPFFFPAYRLVKKTASRRTSRALAKAVKGGA